MSDAWQRRILRRPYHRVLMPEGDGSWFAYVQEFGGCMATDMTPEGALSRLEAVAESWLEATVEQGQVVPEPDPHTWPTGRTRAA